MIFVKNIWITTHFTSPRIKLRPQKVHHQLILLLLDCCLFAQIHILFIHISLIFSGHILSVMGYYFLCFNKASQTQILYFPLENNINMSIHQIYIIKWNIGENSFCLEYFIFFTRSHTHIFCCMYDVLWPGKSIN